MKGIKLIPLNQKGSVAIISAADYNKVKDIKWHLNDQGYAVWRGVKDGVRRTIRMHRLINDTPEGLVTDHLNGNRLDNRKSNLRSVTQGQNSRNRKNTRGICWVSEKKLFVVRYKARFYAYAKNEIEAKRLYNLAKSGIPKPDRLHPRRRLLPAGVYYMQPQASKGYRPFYVRPAVNGKRIFKGYFGTVAEAEIAYKEIKATGGLTS